MKTKMMMTSVSAVALASAAAGAAIAQEAAAPEGGKYTLSFEGTFGRLDEAPADKWGSAGPGDKFGAQSLFYAGAMSLSRDLGENRDVRFGLVFGGTPSNVESFSSGFSVGGSGYNYTSSLTNDLSFGAMDVEVGMTRAVGAGDLRLFGGLRGLASRSSSDLDADKTGTGGNVGDFLNADFDVASSFVGVGPRAGVGFSTGPKMSGFGLSAEVGAAAIFGQRNDEVNIFIDTNSGGPSGGVLSQSVTESQTVMNVDSKVSVDYYFSESAKVSLGYQARQFWNVDAFSTDENPDSNQRLSDGVFLGFATKF
ncbi:MAG: hypothetical protein RIT14_1869 [Pseudomonadota bacterium]